MLAVWDTGLTSTASTPGRRESTDSATDFDEAQCTPDTSSTVVVAVVLTLFSSVVMNPVPAPRRLGVRRRLLR
jgi:hypothetical protein